MEIIPCVTSYFKWGNELSHHGCKQQSRSHHVCDNDLSRQFLVIDCLVIKIRLHKRKTCVKFWQYEHQAFEIWHTNVSRECFHEKSILYMDKYG